jgi:hypothetical protein
MTASARPWRHPLLAFVIDVVLVIAFAAIGRTSHSEGLAPLGILATASPFIAGTAVGWLVVRSLRKSWPVEVGPGITVWFATVLVGMAIRVAAVGSFAWAFLGVAAVTLAVLLIGWRALATRAGTRSARP